MLILYTSQLITAMNMCECHIIFVTGYMKGAAVARQRLGEHMIIPDPLRGSDSINRILQQ
jgi:hypothetical protein